MCGRTVLALEPDDIRYFMGGADWIGSDDYQRSYNVTPSLNQPIVIHKASSQPLIDLEKRHYSPAYTVNENMDRVEVKKPSPKPIIGLSKKILKLHMYSKRSRFIEETKRLGQNVMIKTMKWGLTTSWSVNQKSGARIQPINIRDDSLTTENKPMFKTLKQRQRCCVVAQGFYEWKREGKGRSAIKKPFYSHIDLDERVPIMLLGALYDKAKLNGKTFYSYAIVTTTATKQFSSIHDRMPLMFNPIEDQQAILTWLNPTIPFNQNVLDFLKPYHTPLIMYPVSDEVNKNTSQGAHLLEPVELVDPKPSQPKPLSIKSFFSKKEPNSQPIKSHPSEKRPFSDVNSGDKKITKKIIKVEDEDQKPFVIDLTDQNDIEYGEERSE